MKKWEQTATNLRTLSFQFYVKASSQTLDVFPFVKKRANLR